MAKQKRRIIASILAIMLVISVILSGCGQQPQDEPVDADTLVTTESTDVQESEENQTDEAEPQPTEEPAATEEPAGELSGTYLFEMEQGDSLEFKYSDYNPDYKVGNKITISIEMESAGVYNGCLGTNIGSNYDWMQEEFNSEGGSHTMTWTVTPSLDQAQFNVWYAENGPVGIVSIDVTIEEVEPAVIGKLATFTEQDTFEFTLSEYNSEYKVGDLVKISVVMESDGDFNGSIGASVGRNYTWNQKEFRYEEGGKYTLTWIVKPSSDYSNIGIWWVGGTSVGIHSVTVTVMEEEIGIHGDYITMFTDEGNFEFIPSLINPAFKFGDKIRVKVTLESDGEFTGSLGTCVGDNYEWTQVEYESDTGISTWVMDVSPVIDSVQVGVWFIGGTAVGILDIEIEMLTWGYQHREVKGLIYTATKNNESYTFKPSDYCDFEDGDIITIRVELDSNDVYNGSLGVNDIDGVYRSKTYSSNGGGVVCELVVKGSTKEEAKLDFWWMNTKVALNAITVTKGGTIVDTNGDDIFHPGETLKYRTASDYCDYTAGDTITVTVTLSSDGYFNGALGMAGSDWIQKDFESKDGSPVTCTITVPNAVSTERDIQIGVWWSEGSYVKIEKVTVTKASGSGEDDNKPGDDGKIDTSSWQLAFNGSNSWQSVTGDTGKLEFSATVQDIMTANNVDKISDFSGFIFQIWHIDSKYDGRTYTYRLDINGKTFKEGEGTIKTNQYNSTDVIELAKGDYAFSPTDKITGVITISEGGDQQPEDPSSVVTVFENGKTNESYESDDATWLIEADDNAVVTIVYTCDNAASAGWGVLGWGATVDDEWINGPSYSADNTTATKELTIKTTAGKLRAALGIKSGSEVTAIKLGAWNGGRIISLTIAKPSGTQEPDTAIHTFTYKEWKAIQDNNAATGSNDSYTYIFAPSEYGEFEDGDTINITVTFDAGGKYFNGVLGANDATGSWASSDQQEGEEWTWKLNAAKGNDVQIQLWWMNEDAATVKITDIKVEKDSSTEEPDPDAPIHTFTYDEWKAIQDNNAATGSNDSYTYIFAPSKYGEFEDGDTINITVTFDAGGKYFNGVLGANDATGSWTSSDQQEGEEWTWKLNAAKNNDVQIQLWWMNEDAATVKITDIKVEKDSGTEEPDPDAPIHTFTYDEWKALKDADESYAFTFSPSKYGEFEDGDTINITVTFEADGKYFNGVLGANDATGSWASSDQQEGEEWTWKLNAAKSNDVQIQIWWMNEDAAAVKITDIKVEKDGAAEEPDAPIHTFTYDEWKAIQDNNTATGNSDSYTYSFAPSQYGEFEDGDTINITITYEADGKYFNGVLGANDATGSWASSDQQEGEEWTWKLNAAKSNDVQIQIWWMNEDAAAVKITDIKVEKDGAAEEPDAPIHTFTYDEWKAIQDNNTATGNSDSYTYSFAPSQYGEFEDGDTINITITYEADGKYFNGVLGANDATGSWTSSDQQEGEEWTWTLNAAKSNDVQIQLWWMNEDAAAVKITNIKVEAVTKSNPLALTGIAKKNEIQLPDSKNDDAASVSGNESISGNNSSNTESGSTTAVSGNDAGNGENASGNE